MWGTGGRSGKKVKDRTLKTVGMRHPKSSHGSMGVPPAVSPPIPRVSVRFSVVVHEVPLALHTGSALPSPWPSRSAKDSGSSATMA